MALGLIFDINPDLFQRYDDENIEVFGQDLVDITLKAG